MAYTLEAEEATRMVRTRYGGALRAALYSTTDDLWATYFDRACNMRTRSDDRVRCSPLLGQRISRA